MELLDKSVSSDSEFERFDELPISLSDHNCDESFDVTETEEKCRYLYYILI